MKPQTAAPAAQPTPEWGRSRRHGLSPNSARDMVTLTYPFETEAEAQKFINRDHLFEELVEALKESVLYLESREEIMSCFQDAQFVEETKMLIAKAEAAR